MNMQNNPTKLSPDDAEKFRERVKYEDELLNTRTNIVLTLNGLGAIAMGTAADGGSLGSFYVPLSMSVLMIAIDVLWIVCAFEAASFIRALTVEIHRSGAAPADEIFRQKFRAAGHVRLPPTRYIGIIMPILVLVGWVLWLSTVLR
jgi:hypothetical protein